MSKLTHNELARKMGLFRTFEEAGSGHIFWEPNGFVVFDSLREWIQKAHEKRGYEFVKTPIIYRTELWKTSGHYDKYKENMYFLEVDGEEYGIKPMNCPAHILIYKSRFRHASELPLKLFEFGFVHRHELSGVLNGLLRVRSFTQDDSHIFCKPSHIQQVVSEVLELVNETFDKFGLHKRKYYLSTMPEKHIGTKEMWDSATEMLKKALNANNISYELKEGDGAFYGPKIDVEVLDSLGRSWQLGTIQLDFNLPERFKLSYVDEEGRKQRPVMVHRAILGSLERFLGVLLEHTQGWLPLFLMPKQLEIIPLTEEQKEYAESILNNIKERMPGSRISVEEPPSNLSKTIKASIERRVPLLLIGKNEVEKGTVAFRYAGEQKEMPKEDFIDYFSNEAEI
ncbi:MAG: threonine--tRNA ligase [Methanobacteriota archaeon]|nr:MAG: threonine--tRNA ligase [Euryarchaeota archaeon]